MKKSPTYLSLKLTGYGTRRFVNMSLNPVDLPMENLGKILDFNLSLS
jgi:hypothetical protein